jgi:hypothetical protein
MWLNCKTHFHAAVIGLSAFLVVSGHAAAHESSRQRSLVISLNNHAPLYQNGTSRIVDMRRGHAGHRVSGVPYAAPYLAYPPTSSVQQVTQIRQPDYMRHSVTYEVPTMVGIRPAPIGEPVIYVIEQGKGSRSGRVTVRR